jgi:hypothetical protein
MQCKRIIRIYQQRIHLNAYRAFELYDTNLSEGALTFGRNHDIYWEVIFDEGSFAVNTLTFVVSNYHPKDIRGFSDQPVADSLHKLNFTGIHWGELERHLISYRKGPLDRAGIVIEREAVKDPLIDFARQRSAFTARPKFTPPEPEPRTIIHKDSASIRYEDAEFFDNHITFRHRFHWHNQQVRFKIDNAWLKKEYDYIRFYFARAMDNNPSFEVVVEVTITDGIVTEAKARSNEIDKIDAQVIDSIKYHRVMNLVKAPSMRKKRSLFTAKDIFENFEKENAGNLFKQTEEELLQYLLANRVVRNEQQLKCLSAELHSRAQKLRFTLNPFFGFVFYLEGRSNHFFCWELLDSHATYLWSFPRGTESADTLYFIVEEQISIIETVKREQYRKMQKEKPSLDFRFIPLEHTQVNESAQSFDNWKAKLDRVLME